MDVLLTIGYILLFIVLLSALVIIHELGHFSAAKAFKVYCFEFSCGFGPAIISKKRKNGETKFSWRAIPFGGYVSMYGEGVEIPEGLSIPKERSLESVKKYKKAIILFAGVFMNAVLALVLFFIGNIACDHKTIFVSTLQITESISQKNKKSLQDNNMIDLETGYVNLDYYEVTSNYFILSPINQVEIDGKNVDFAAAVSRGGFSSFDDLNVSDHIHFFPASLDKDSKVNYDFENEIKASSVFKDNKISFKIGRYSTKNDCYLESNIILKDGNYYFENLGLNFYLNIERYSFGKSVQQSFVDFGDSATAVVRGIGSLFTSKEAIESAGGIIAIGFESTNILKNFGIERFIYMWGLISVNLAIFNLLPFPGLDGWQLLVLLIESVSHKQIPNKVKNAISVIGLVLLMALMVLLLFKDAFKYIF